MLTANHRSNLEKCEDLFNVIIFAYLLFKKKELGYLELGRATFSDCHGYFKGHDNDEMKRLSTKNNFELVTLPHNFTNKFQSLNISVNQAVRKFISKKLWYADRVSKQLSSGIAPDDVIVNLKLSDLKSVDANLFTTSHVQSSQKTKRFNNQRF